MPRPLFDSETIFGIHEPGGERLMLDAGRLGWLAFSEALGHDPENRTGVDFTSYSDQGLGIICRLNHGYEPDGTLPHSSQYEAFARRVANFVSISRGCKIWVIGNEMNYAVERPGIYIDWSRHATRRDGPPEGADPLRRGISVRFNALPEQSHEIRTTRGAIVSQGEVLAPDLYVRCYRLCRDAIHRLPGHENDQVLVGAPAPWNTQTMYSGNPNGDWVLYFRHILEALGPDGCDGFTLHTFTHSPDSALISSTAKLPPPFQNYHVHFRAYMDFMNVVPPNMRHLPAYITETGQAQPWPDRNDGWIQRAYAEIDAWNRGTSSQGVNQKIRALILYRWPRLDKWYIEGKRGVEADFREALKNDYRWERGSRVAGLQGGKEAGGQANRGVGQENAETIVVAPVAEPRRSQNQRAKVQPPYRAEWLEDHFPEKLVIGQTMTVSVTVRNAGLQPWLVGGGNPFRIGYHYFRSRKRLPMTGAQDARTDLPADVAPGETVTVPVRVVLPDKAGNYTLEIDLVQEGVGWLKEQRSPVLSRWLTVELPTHMTGGVATVRRNLPVPLFLDVSASLPRSGSPYARRDTNQIRHIVISHTAAHPSLSLERIAKVHIAAGHPGIAYDFVVDGSGQIFRTKEMDFAAQPDQVWSEQGVNVCLAGNFGATAPPLTQLDAAGRLCAWLAQNLGLGAEAIVGLGELTRTDNPGSTFYRGATWKEIIMRQVQLHLAALGMGALDSSRSDDLSSQIELLQNENRQLLEQSTASQSEQERLRSFNERLQSELAVRQRELEAVRGDSGTNRLPISELWRDLPRDATRFRRRRDDEVNFFVIHHTGAPADTPIPQLAAAMRREWPGILYDYVIDGQGIIHQTQPPDQVIASSEAYLVNAIGIALAGNFDQEIPSNEQLHASGRLIAWLMERYPQVTTDTIKGVSEFTTSTSSPGRQWLLERRWKDRLLAAVRRTSGMVDPREVENELRSRVEELENRLVYAERTTQAAQEVKSRLEAEKGRLQVELEQRAQPVAATFAIPRPAARPLIDQLPRHPSLRYERRSLSQITHIAVHHTAAPANLPAARIAELHIAADANRGKEAWPGIGYHFLIQADGAIDQTNLLEVATYHVYRHFSYSVGVCFAGSFMNGRIPTSAQLRAGAHLIAWLMQELNVPLARVWGHKEFPENSTICPGSEWTQGNRWRDLLFERIEQVQSGAAVKPIRHYILLWQRPYPGPVARQDLVNATGYFVRFRPTVGFRVEDAQSAEYVTIVGSEAGISAATEKQLVDAGCKVERISGRDEDETARLLAELVRAGRRFAKFEVDF